MNLKETSKFIAKRRKELGLTQEQLAQQVNVTAKAVSKWERGLSFPDIALFNHLAIELKCSVNDLINGSFLNCESSKSNFRNEITEQKDLESANETPVRFDFDSEKYVSPFLFGNNLEHTRNCIHSGLSAQMIENRKFVGKPCPNGCAQMWKPIGENAFFEFSESYTKHAQDYHMKRMLECNAQRIINFTQGSLCGLRQDGLYILQNKEYSFSFAVKSFRTCSLTISLNDCDHPLCKKSIVIEPANDYVEKEITLRPCKSCDNAALEITFDTENTIDIGAVSLMPSDNFHGMRKDLNDDSIRISFDEWNAWYAWYRKENVCDGIFAAAAIHAFINEAEYSGIDIVCHFEAVNEGAIQVDQNSSKLTPMGTMFALMKRHKYGQIFFQRSYHCHTKQRYHYNHNDQSFL